MASRLKDSPKTEHDTGSAFGANSVHTDSESVTTKSDADAPNPFDPARLRLTADANATLGVKKALLSVPVRKPEKSWWVRTHPNPEYQLPTAVIELKGDRGETYLVEQSLWPALAAESTFAPRALFTSINRQGALFLWPVRLPGRDGRTDEWSRTALESANAAKDSWIRVTANMSLGAYDLFTATGDIPDPVWPDHPMCDVLRIAFKDRFINSMDHPVLRSLRGEV